MGILDFMTKRPLDTAETRGIPHVHSSSNTIKAGHFFPKDDGRLHQLLNGFYSRQNFIELFYCVPEVAAPVHEIASRVASMTFNLRKSWDDELDYTSPIYEHFRELIEDRPNPRDTFEEMIYMSVCYEILTGRTFFYKNNPSLMPVEFSSIVALWAWPAHQVCVNQRQNINVYAATTMNDLVESYKVPVSSGMSQLYEPDEVLPIINGSLLAPNDIGCGVPHIKGAEIAIKNLIPVYEARGVIYIKRGAMGFFVSKKSDDSGTQPLTKTEKERVNKDFNETYGLTGNRNTVGITDVPLEFIRTAMSIKELEPFAETEADAAAIYAVLRVPPHLMPKKDKSTFANAETDMKTFYTKVIIPWAQKYAKLLTPFMGLDKVRRYIDVDTSNIDELQENKKDKADVDNKNGQTFLSAFLSGAATLGQWVIARGEKVPPVDLYKKYLFEMTPEEREEVRSVLNIKSNVTQQPPATNGDTQTA